MGFDVVSAMVVSASMSVVVVVLVSGEVDAPVGFDAAVAYAGGADEGEGLEGGSGAIAIFAVWMRVDLGA